MHNILVPTDFSLRANNALSLAKVIGSQTRATITLLHVVELPGKGHTSTGDDLNAGQRADVYVLELIEKAERELKALQEANQSDQFDLKIEIKKGEPFNVIRAFAETHQIDLIIAGDKGHTEFEDIFIGSLSDKLVRTMACPVITVKSVIPDRPLTNIVYVVNGDKDEEPVMKYLKNLNTYFKAKIHLVWINTPANFKDDIETKGWMSGIARDYQLENYTINIHNHHDEEFGVVYFSDEVRADLIVMGISSRTVVQRLITGDSLAEEVSDHSIRPVMTMKLV